MCSSLSQKTCKPKLNINRKKKIKLAVLAIAYNKTLQIEVDNA